MVQPQPRVALLSVRSYKQCTKFFHQSNWLRVERPGFDAWQGHFVSYQDWFWREFSVSTNVRFSICGVLPPFRLHFFLGVAPRHKDKFIMFFYYEIIALLLYVPPVLVTSNSAFFPGIVLMDFILFSE
jgi:hypothetical protein